MSYSDREALIASIVKRRPAIKRLIPRPITLPRESVSDEVGAYALPNDRIDDAESEDGSPIVSKTLLRALKAPKDHMPDDELLFTDTERRQIAKDVASHRARFAAQIIYAPQSFNAIAP